MELRNFIKETLHQIAWGTKDAQSDLPPNARVAPSNLMQTNRSAANLIDQSTGEMATVVEFDVAITTQEDTATKGSEIGRAHV